MKLSVRPKFGATTVRGGQILRVSHNHQVSTRGYDPRPDKIHGNARVFETPWVTAFIGDLAIEIITTKTGKILGHAYLSGHAINIIRYRVAEDDPAEGWFTPAKALALKPFPQDTELPVLVDWMRDAKYAEADIVVGNFACPKGLLYKTLEMFTSLYRQVSEDSEAKPLSADFIARVKEEGSKEFARIHFQIPERAQDQAVQPFQCDLLLSSPAVQAQ